MKLDRFPLIFAISLFASFPGAGFAQRSGTPIGQQPTQPGQPNNAPFSNDPFGTYANMGRGTLIVTVADEHGLPLNEQALVKVYSNTTAYTAWGTTEKRSEAQFNTLSPGEYEIEASAAGFATATQSLNIMTSTETTNVLIHLKLDTSGSAASLSTKPGQLLAPKAQKETEKGLTALKSGNLNDAQKHLDAAYKLAPTNADVVFLLGYLSVQRKDPAQARTYFQKATSINPDHLRALTALGRLLVEQEDYKDAIAPLEKAVSIDAGHWEAHWMLAGAYLHVHENEKARDQAQLAIQTGKGAADGAQVELGEALANLGKTQEAIQAFQTYLEANPKSPAATQIRDVISQLQNPPKLDESRQPTPVALKDAAGAPALAAPDSKLSLPTWGPPNVDDDKPVISVGTKCPSDHVIEQAGKRVKELVDDLSNFDATESVVHEDLDELGKSISKDTRKFDYTVTISEPQKDVLAVDEYRNGLTDRGNFPGGIATRGLPALAFVFHPDRRDDFDMVCEGLGHWNGQATWLVHFRQRPDKPSRELTFNFTNASVNVDLKGRAWISASNYQIVRLEADLVNPLRNIQLLTEHQVVEYKPVKFTKMNTVVWLPSTADVYMDFRKERFHRQHSFSHYMLFSVGTSQKIGGPKSTDTTQQNPN